MSLLGRMGSISVAGKRRMHRHCGFLESRLGQSLAVGIEPTSADLVICYRSSVTYTSLSTPDSELILLGS